MLTRSRALSKGAQRFGTHYRPRVSLLVRQRVPINALEVHNRVWKANFRYLSSESNNEEQRPKISWMPLKSAVIGMTMGSMQGMVSIGGGFVAIPMMTALLRATQHQAQGTTMVSGCVAGFSGVYTFYEYGNGAVDMFAGSIIAVTASTTVPLAVLFAKRLSGRTLRKLMALFSLSCAALFFGEEIITRYFKSDLIEEKNSEAETNYTGAVKFASWEEFAEVYSKRLASPDLYKFAILGVLAGGVAGTLGVGGALLLLPMLSITTDMNQSVIVGTILLGLIPVTVTGSISNALVGNLLWKAVPTMVIGSLIGSHLGGRFALYLSEEQQRFTAIGFLSGISLYMLRHL